MAASTSSAVVGCSEIALLLSESDDSDSDFEFSSSGESSPESFQEVSDDSEHSDHEPVAKRRRGVARPSYPEWKESDFSPTLFQFAGDNSGIKNTVDVSDQTTELEVFKLFFDEVMMNHIVSETNRYMVLLKSQPDVKAKSRLHDWQQAAVPEMFTFLGLVMLMALQKKLKIQDYWSTDPLILSPMFGKIMPCRRFELLLRALHFNDNETPVPDDKLYKVRPILEMLKLRFSNVFHPYKNLVIDESLMLWKGRLSFKQYIPSKRHRFGVKLFILCDCKTGYVLDFIVYTGASTEIIEPEGDIGISGAIVLTLMEPFLGNGHTLYTDNWYTSPALSDKLHSSNTGTCGTVKSNRKNFPKFAKTKKGDLLEKNTDKLLAVKWHDKREVHMLSSVDLPGKTPTGKKDRRTQEDILKPKCVKHYNQNMGSIDKSDMQLSFVECIRKSVKWYKKFFFHLLDLAVLNAYILFKEIHGNKKLEFSKFRLELIRQIFQEHHEPRVSPKGGRHSKVENPVRLTERHFPSHIEPTEKKKAPTRVCVVCSQTTLEAKKRRESRYMCLACDVGLCVSPCFQKYHTQLRF